MNTKKYIKWVEEHGNALLITHQNCPDLVLSKIKLKSLKDLHGLVDIKIHGDVNDHILPECNPFV